LTPNGQKTAKSAVANSPIGKLLKGNTVKFAKNHDFDCEIFADFDDSVCELMRSHCESLFAQPFQPPHMAIRVLWATKVTPRQENSKFPGEFPSWQVATMAKRPIRGDQMGQKWSKLA
jgi:hypothetical protein